MNTQSVKLWLYNSWGVGPLLWGYFQLLNVRVTVSMRSVQQNNFMWNHFTSYYLLFCFITRNRNEATTLILYGKALWQMLPSILLNPGKAIGMRSWVFNVLKLLTNIFKLKCFLAYQSLFKRHTLWAAWRGSFNRTVRHVVSMVLDGSSKWPNFF